MHTPKHTNEQTGTLKKRIQDMTPEERTEHYANAAVEVRKRLFVIGQPLVHQIGDYVVAEHADGRIVKIRKITNLNQLERLYFYLKDRLAIILSSIRLVLLNIAQKIGGKQTPRSEFI